MPKGASHGIAITIFMITSGVEDVHELRVHTHTRCHNSVTSVPRQGPLNFETSLKLRMPVTG